MGMDLFTVIGILILVAFIAGMLIWALVKKPGICVHCRYQTWSIRYGKKMPCCKIYGCPTRGIEHCKSFDSELEQPHLIHISNINNHNLL